MNPDLDTLATRLYVTIDDLLAAHPEWVPERLVVGIAPKLSDAELLTLAVLQALGGQRQAPPEPTVPITPEGLYGRRKMVPLVRRWLPDATPGSVDRPMRSLGLWGVRRSKGVRTTIPAKDGRRAGDLMNRDFTAAAPNPTWVMDFTYVRTWAGFVYVAFVVDVYAQRIVAWNAATTRETDLSRWDLDDILAVQDALNSRPRKILRWKTPAEVLDDHLRSLHPAGVATTD